MTQTADSAISTRSGTGGERRLTGARAAARALIDNGVTDLFGVHGYINPVIEEACRLGARMWHFRHEQAAGFAAEAYGRVMRKPGVFFVSASAGMANCLSSLSQGIGTKSPMLLLVGQHGTAGDRLETLQEGYAAEAFETVAKWTKRVTDWELNSYWVRKALVDATTYPAGPVVLEFPLNNQWSYGDAAQRKYVPSPGLPAIPATQADPKLVEEVAQTLANAERPLLIAGDGVYWSDGSEELVALAEMLNAPTAARRTARGAISERHPLAVHSGYRGPLLREADVVMTIGLRAGELESWFEPPDWPSSEKATYLQIQETAEELWHGLDTKVNVLGSSKLVLAQIIEALRPRIGGRAVVERPEWVARVQQARTAHERRRAETLRAVSGRHPIHTHELAQAIIDEVDEDATYIYDSYQGSLYLTDAVKATFPGQVLDAGPRVALGQGIGMCFGAGVARPGKQIVSLVGDGGIGLAGMDLETLARYRIPALIVVLNNSSWGGNSLVHDDIQPDIGSWDMLPDLRYDEVFAPFGCHVEHVTESEQLRPALRRALDSDKVAVVNVIADTDGPEASIPWLRLKTGEFFSRGVEDLPESTLRYFRGLSLIETLRLHKTALDNGTRIPMSFMADLTGNAEADLLELANKSGYRY
ncbi:MAG TPA: thiamine pyrophosphate-binding protein [Amycolatopsis sp.]|nr:thiamine pyrophosphate-binding protein [Amycolatopsis sp.]